MSEFASEVVSVPTHVDWCDDLRNLVEKIVKQDGEYLNLEAMSQQQSIIIGRLMDLVLSLDMLLEWCVRENKGSSKKRLFITNFKNHQKVSHDALAELGMEIPFLFADTLDWKSHA